MSDDSPKKVSIDSHKLHRFPKTEALKAFGDFIGSPASWASSHVRHRIENDCDEDWRTEVGNWILLARKHGFEAHLQKRLNGARTEDSNDINDPAHRQLLSELAPVMLAHYLIGTDWRFGTWEPPQAEPKADIDETLFAPNDVEVAFQVKAPDTPGKWVDRETTAPNGSVIKRSGIFNGAMDDWVRTAVEKAARQLPRAPTRPQMIALCAQRQLPLPLGSSPRVIDRLLLGSPINIDGTVRLDHDYIDSELAANSASPLSRGEFRDHWNHIGGVVTLDYRRNWSEFDYMCTVILNPWAQEAARCERIWFPHARVLALDGDTFSWTPAVPDDTSFRVPVIYVASRG
jgi:hypothetical protein